MDITDTSLLFTPTQPRLLFHSITNLDLSVMAKALLVAIPGQPFVVESAGDNPYGKEGLSSAAVTVMREVGIDISDEGLNFCTGCFLNEPAFDYAIALSIDNFEGCTHVASETRHAYWRLLDSTPILKSDWENISLLRQARERLRSRITRLADLALSPEWFANTKEEQEHDLREIHDEVFTEESERKGNVSTRAREGVVGLRESEPASDPPKARKVYYLRFSPEDEANASGLLDHAEGWIQGLRSPFPDDPRTIYLLGANQFEAVQPWLKWNKVKFEVLEVLPTRQSP